MELFTVKDLGQGPIIVLNRQLAESDFGPVKEKGNSIMFILDDTIWEQDERKNTYVAKVRLREAETLREEINKHKLTTKASVLLTEILQVYGTECPDQSDESYDKLKKDAIKGTTKAIEEFNNHQLKTFFSK